jgi:hypothetical protein
MVYSITKDPFPYGLMEVIPAVSMALFAHIGKKRKAY